MPHWNERQQDVLDSITEDQNILVSAAAGSGKTAVLVERIIQTVQQGLADIDEILVVTFTIAAAAQMRSKILAALEKMACTDSRMARQLALAENADIMTIDSFCNKIVRENFSLVGMDPSFEIYDKNEIQLLKDDVLTEVLNKYYEDDETMEELSAFAFRKNIDDSAIKEFILKIHNVSQSFADSKRWLEEARERIVTDEDAINQKWVVDYKRYLKLMAGSYVHALNEYAEYFEEEKDIDKISVAQKVVEVFNDDVAILGQIMNAQTLAEMKAAVPPKWKTFSVKKKVEELYGEETQNAISNMRQGFKDEFKTIFTEDEIKDDSKAGAGFFDCLINIVSDFDAALLEEKRKQKKFEFADVSHAAFNILFDVEKLVSTEIGERKSREYKYIYIDEYQDSSDLQENLLNAVARKDALGNPKNVFMVGDIKQSIYRFRMARPELFVEKSINYLKNEGGALINLNMNYRSRGEILDAVNFVFRKIMSEDFGGIEYNHNTELHVPEKNDYRNHFPETDLLNEDIPELYLIEMSDNRDDISLEKEEVQAVEIGRRILEMVNGSDTKPPAFVLNESFNEDRPESDNNPRYRKADFGDIVILQRIITGNMDMVRIYEQMGIPVYIDDSEGYFDAIEIETLLSVLRVIDNIQQDIPYASVLLSHIVGLSDTDLAIIVGLSADGRMSLADKCNLFEKGYINSEDENLRIIAEKLRSFSTMLSKWTELRPYLSISDMLDRVLVDTRIETFVAAMPDGRRRLANIKKLGVYARRFESVRTASLLDFLRYIDKCRIHNMDFDDPNAATGTDQVVRIMSIHKSKGLEFPIVIIPMLEKAFRFNDKKGAVAVSSDYHLIIDNIKTLKSGVKVKKKSIKGEVVSLLEKKEIKAEEARLFYVAMTRAKEKLVMLGYAPNKVPVTPMSCKSYMDFVLFALNNSDDKPAIKSLVVSEDEIVQDFKKKFVKKNLDYKESTEKLLEKINDNLKDYTFNGENPYDYKYPFETSLATKMSVSEIKHMEMEKYKEDESSLPEETNAPEEVIPEEVIAEMTGKAALRGTITHAIFENLDYGNVISKESLKFEMERALSELHFKDEEKELVKIDYLLKFYSEDEGSLFQMMRKAFMEDKLYRERQFIAGLRPDEIPGVGAKVELSAEDGHIRDITKDYIMIQGIIDAYFYQGPDDDIILVDYKTDNVESGEELLGRYAAQMYLYALTLEKLTGHKVKDIILYSTRLGEIHYNNWREYKL